MEYKDLNVWKESRKLVNAAYSLTKLYPKEELYGPTSQMRRCPISIPSKIAEGCGRRTSTDTIQFSHIARGSLYELETQLFLSLDQSYIEEHDMESLLNQTVLCKKLLNGSINYYKNNS